MRPAIHDATARQNSGEPLSVIGQAGGKSNGPRRPAMSAEDEIAELVDRLTHQLRLSWRKLYRREPPLGLSRDLMIRVLANQIQERAHGGPSRSLKRNLHTLAGEFEKGSLSLDPWCRAEDGREAGAAVARTRPHCSRAPGRVRV
jgi:hypothetical protein